jgi:hypothetical protein
MATYTLSVEEMGRAATALYASSLPGSETLADDFQAAFVAQATDIILSDVQHEAAMLGMNSAAATPSGGRVIASKLLEQRFS